MTPWKGARTPRASFRGSDAPARGRLAAWLRSVPAGKAGASSPRVRVGGLVAPPPGWSREAGRAAPLARPLCGVIIPALLVSEPGVCAGARRARGLSGVTRPAADTSRLSAPPAPHPNLLSAVGTLGFTQADPFPGVRVPTRPPLSLAADLCSDVLRVVVI